jgi:hypothetical protein
MSFTASVGATPFARPPCARRADRGYEPGWASEIASWAPDRPRATSLRRNASRRRPRRRPRPGPLTAGLREHFMIRTLRRLPPSHQRPGADPHDRNAQPAVSALFCPVKIHPGAPRRRAWTAAALSTRSASRRVEHGNRSHRCACAGCSHQPCESGRCPYFNRSSISALCGLRASSCTNDRKTSSARRRTTGPDIERDLHE